MPVIFRIFAALLPVMALLCALSPEALSCNGSPSQPQKVIFYPDEAQLVVEEELSPITLPSGGKGFALVLPAGLIPDTFAISVEGVPARGYYWPDKNEREAILDICRREPAPGDAALPENERSPARRVLLEKLVPLAQEAARRQGELNATSQRLELWRKSFETYGMEGKSRNSQADEAAKLDALYAEQYPQLYKDAEMQRRALEDAQKKLARAEKELRDFDTFQSGRMVVIPLEGPAGEKFSLRYDYVLSAACSISYRLDAKPDEEAFRLDQDVTLNQNSGFAWNDVDLYVSTVRRDKTLRPRDIRPWQIALVSKPGLERKKQAPSAPAPAFVARQQSAVADEAKPLATGEANMAYQQLPMQEERGTFRLWSLGKRSVAYGTPVTLSLASDTHKAKFRYTLRPVSSPMGFLTAEVALEKALELPPGMAQFSVDGAGMGRQRFSFNGDSGIIFFGSDPQVTATMRDLKQSSGEQGFFSKEQTRSWHWQITLKSSRAKPVQVTLEDPAPVTEVEAINIITQSMPRPEEVVNEPKYGGARIYRWNATLQPGEPLLVDHQIQVVAPLTPGMEISPGR